MENIDQLVLKYNELFESGERDTAHNEVKSIIDDLVSVTSKTYNQKTLNYAKLRNEKPSQETILEMLKTISLLSDKSERYVEILDAGAGHGRDLMYLNTLDYVNVTGTDISENFLRILKQYENEGVLPANSCYLADIRDMSIFEDECFDIVRYNASLLHLPISRYDDLGVNAVLLEAKRILKNRGIIYIRVKEGQGFKAIDTGDGLGKRCFQFYTEESLKDILKQYGFWNIEIEKRKGAKHRIDDVVWLSAYARKG